MNGNTINKCVSIFELIFKICFLLYGLATLNSFFFHTKVISVLLYAATASAGVVLIYRIINFKYFIHEKTYIVSCLFLISYILSFVLNIEYANIHAIKYLVFMGMQFFLLLAVDERKDSASLKKEILLILNVFELYMFFAALASIVLLFMGYGNIVYRNEDMIISGFVWGRLWGVFTDPNFGSVLSSISVIISLYFCYRYSSRISILINVVNITLQLMYISFSDSRTGKLVVMIAVALYFYLRFMDVRTKMKACLKNIVCVLLAVCVAAVCATVLTMVNKGYNSVIYSVAEKRYNLSDDFGDDFDQDFIKNHQLGREKDIEQDFSNRRIDLWKSAIETLKLRPMFGVSFESLVDYVKDKLPDTYLVNNDHGVFNNYHNMLFNVIVGQGIVGFTLLIVMIVFSGISMIKLLLRSFGNSKEYMLNATIFTVLVSTLISSMFVTEIMYAFSANMMLFWYLLGYMLYEEKKVTGEGDAKQYIKNGETE